MYDPTDDRPRYLVHYSDGGSGMRRQDALIQIGDELRNARYALPRRPRRAPR